MAVTTGGGTQVVPTNGQRRLPYGDGTNVVAVAPDFASVGGGGGGGGGFPAFKGALLKRTTNLAIADSTQTTLGWESEVYDTDGFADLGAQATRLTIPSGVSKVRLKGNIDWTFGGSGYRHIWMHKNGGLFFGAAKESDAGDSGLQNASTAVVEVTAGDYFELIARQTSGSTKNVVADELTWFAVEVVE